MENSEMIAFGPVPSRRLGKSLGINNIPAKICTYSCVYCQVGKTISLNMERTAFYRSNNIFQAVKNKVDEALSRNESIDYLTFVPDGEPTLDSNFKEEIALLKEIDIPLAVITNSSLLWREDVREDLLEVDFVSIKVDAVTKELWKRINRPHKNLRLNAILEGLVDFTREFKGILVSETMLIDKVSYNNEFRKIGEFLGTLKGLNTTYLAIPTRPPAIKWVTSPSEAVINQAFQEFSKVLGIGKVEYLIGYEGNAFAFTGNVEADLLGITAVHPMRKEAVEVLLKKANTNWDVVAKLLKEEKIIKVEFEENEYYLRKLPTRKI